MPPLTLRADGLPAVGDSGIIIPIECIGNTFDLGPNGESNKCLGNLDIELEIELELELDDAASPDGGLDLLIGVSSYG